MLTVSHVELDDNKYRGSVFIKSSFPNAENAHAELRSMPARELAITAAGDSGMFEPRVTDNVEIHMVDSENKPVSFETGLPPGQTPIWLARIPVIKRVI